MQILAAGLVPNIANLRQTLPYTVSHYAYLLGGAPGGLFTYRPGSLFVHDDGYTTILPANPPSGGGAWVLTPVDDRGETITTTSGGITTGPYNGAWQRIPVSTLTGSLTITLDPNNLDGVPWPDGSTVELTRYDESGYTVTVNNGGPGAGTLCTFPASSQARGLFFFDGTNWIKRDAHVLL